MRTTPLQMTHDDVRAFNARLHGRIFRIVDVTDYNGNTKTDRAPYNGMLRCTVVNVHADRVGDGTHAVYMLMNSVLNKDGDYVRQELTTSVLTHFVDSVDTIKLMTGNSVFILKELYPIN